MVLRRINGAAVTQTTEHAAELRRELCARNLAFAQTNGLTHVLSYGELPVIVYARKL